MTTTRPMDDDDTTYAWKNQTSFCGHKTIIVNDEFFKYYTLPSTFDGSHQNKSLCVVVVYVCVCVRARVLEL